MPVHRVLSEHPVESLAAHRAAGGLEGLEGARAVEPDVVVQAVADSGLRGRGGAGFPTGTKWRTVADNARESSIAPTVAVNAAEGEPGTFGDRTLIRRNPYKVLEGALVAAHAVGARDVVVVTKERFDTELGLLTVAAHELDEAGVSGDVRVEVVGGASHYLLGEETGLLEAAAGRPPFPRLAAPYRHGATEVGDPSGGAATLELSGSGVGVPPTLVNNVETLCHAADVARHGAEWFRELGTTDSPGTTVFTVSGDVAHAGVAELPLGTPIAEVIETVGGGMAEGLPAFVLTGTGVGPVRAEDWSTPTTHDAMDAVGSGLGAGGLIVFSTASDPVAVAAGVSRFLAVESCGQCTPCKETGLDVADHLAGLCDGDVRPDEVERIGALLRQVPVGARCDLGRQHERVVAGILAAFPDVAVAHATDGLAADPVLIAPILDIVDGEALLDEDQATKQPDWTHDERWSGASPADRYDVAVSIA